MSKSNSISNNYNNNAQNVEDKNKKIISATSEDECPNHTDFQCKDSNPKKFKNEEESKKNEYDRQRDNKVVNFGFVFISLLCIAMIVIAFYSKELFKEVVDFFKSIILISIGYIFSRYISDK